MPPPMPPAPGTSLVRPRPTVGSLHVAVLWAGIVACIGGLAWLAALGLFAWPLSGAVRRAQSGAVEWWQLPEWEAP